MPLTLTPMEGVIRLRDSFFCVGLSRILWIFDALDVPSSGNCVVLSCWDVSLAMLDKEPHRIDQAILRDYTQAVAEGGPSS